ncbi:MULTISPECIES: ABC transporter ATP-binding protein [Acinetobacter]|uniref:ABC transporter ATP-binding protein n=1 Tax=Acinetobacter TaxID=469 RepID=UPI000EA2F2C5|nr:MULTISPECIES: ATP-binding cassette domain-containing protein [Acinetobacter]RKG46095.1 ATP-binding cassette domain-containing protein [Acinetobacter cumulans]RZG61265.1 ATP-binding cassette domain-containing protein [Acinetobacter sp. WCHAc060006]
MLKSLIQLWNILSKLDKRKVIYVLFLIVGMAFIESLGVMSIMPFLAVLSDPNIVNSNPTLKLFNEYLDFNDTKKTIVVLGLISLGIVIFSTFFKVITQYAVNRFASLQRHYFSTKLLKIYLQQDYKFFIERNSSNLAKNILSEVDQLIWTMILPTLSMLSYGIVLVSMIGILLVYDPVMAISTASVLFVFYSIIYFIVRKKLAQIGIEFTEANQNRFQICQEALSGIKDVIINNAKDGYIEEFEKSSRIFARHIATRETLSQIPLNIIETVGYGCLIGLAIILVLSDKDVSEILPVLGLYGFAAYRMLPAAQSIYRSLAQLKFSQQVLNVLYPEFKIGYKEKIIHNLNSDQTLNFSKTIKLENITFSYNNDRKIIKNFSMEIEKNTSIGIVGKSGSGKSTLMDIMLGLLKPQQGKIRIDDVEIELESCHEWRDIVGYVPQSIYLADKSIAENIAFGIPIDEINMDQVILVAQQAQIHEFINNDLPQGYNEIIGERGIKLSGGQRQRVGIARALYKKPQVLFMDEATSALDDETERLITQSIAKLNGQITMVIIAHRLNTLAYVDKKIVL